MRVFSNAVTLWGSHGRCQKSNADDTTALGLMRNRRAGPPVFDEIDSRAIRRSPFRFGLKEFLPPSYELIARDAVIDPGFILKEKVMRASLAVAVASAIIGLSTPAFAELAAPAGTMGGDGLEPQQSAPDTAPAQAPPASLESTPAAAVPVAISPAAEKLRDLVTRRLSSVLERKPEQAAVEAFYRGRAFQPLWTTDGVALPRATAAVEFLRNVKSEGLDPRDYPTPDFSAKMDDDQAAANDLKLTAAVLTYARHASAGRVSFTRVSGAILYPPHVADPAAVLSQIASAEDVRATLLSFEPQQPGFKALKAQLAKELAVSDRATADARHDRSVKRRGNTAAAGGRSDVIGTLVANMERWRWLPRDLGPAYVMVNVPDYTLGLFNKGRLVWRTKIVVGQPGDKATPLLSETMKYLTVNPTWNVPPSIIRNEYLPALERDPDALERTGLKVGRNNDGSIRVYQPPGDRNALGRIRFNFPNPFLVYQHDTPNKNLFAREDRALSHGCMRVQYPDKYAEALLSVSQPEDDLTAQRIRSYYGDDERTIKLKNPIPVHITYQTAFVDDVGHLKLRPDIYGLDAAVLKLMRGSERLIADTPIARNYESSSKPVMARLPSRPVAERVEGNWDWDRGSRGARAYAAYPSTGQAFDQAKGIW